MNIIAVIPARSGSKGITGKNLRVLDGKPLVYYQMRNAYLSSRINRAVISTDSKKWIDIIQGIREREFFGTHKLSTLLRPKELGKDNVMLEPVIDNVLDWVSEFVGQIDIVCVLQPTSPLLNHTIIDGALDRLINYPNMDSIFTASEFHGFTWEKNIGNFYFNCVNHYKKIRRQDMTPQYLENGAFYAIKMKAYKKYRSMLCGKIGMYQMWKRLSPEIDSNDDLKICDAMLKYERGAFNE